MKKQDSAKGVCKVWYRLSQKTLGIGGGALKSSPSNDSVLPAEQHAKMWDVLVNQTDHIGNRKGEPNETTGDQGAINEGQATQGTEMRRVSPYHSNPEHTTLEEQLETARQQNVNNDPIAMTQNNFGTGEMLIRGVPQYSSGKGWVGFQGNNPSAITLV